MRDLVLRVLIVSLLSIMFSTASMAGIKLFSYQDDLGQIIVVDSLEKVPIQYRDRVEQDFIPSFSRPKKKETKENITIIEPLVDSGSDQIRVAEPDDEKPAIVPPPEEDRSAEIASATAFMQIIEQIHFNNERIHVIATSINQNSPAVYQLHNQNIQTMNQLSALNSFVWENGKTWKSEALRVIEDMKTIQYTISKWIKEGGTGLRYGLPPFLNRLKQSIKDLDALLKQAIASENNQND